MLGHDWSGPKLEEMWSDVAKSHFKRQIEKQNFEVSIKTNSLKI